MQKQGILGGINLNKWGIEGHLLVTVTEKRTKKEIDRYVEVMREAVGN
jgi:glycine cleavage system pyridoxal-binding protein P